MLKQVGFFNQAKSPATTSEEACFFGRLRMKVGKFTGAATDGRSSQKVGPTPSRTPPGFSTNLYLSVALGAAGAPENSRSFITLELPLRSVPGGARQSWLTRRANASEQRTRQGAPACSREAAASTADPKRLRPKLVRREGEFRVGPSNAIQDTCMNENSGAESKIH